MEISCPRYGQKRKNKKAGARKTLPLQKNKVTQQTATATQRGLSMKFKDEDRILEEARERDHKKKNIPKEIEIFSVNDLF